jgi:seryl-tRNA synthetase
MLELPYLRENKEQAIEALDKRQIEAESLVGQVLEIDAERRSLLSELEKHKHEMNLASKEIGLAFKNGDRERAEELKLRSSELKEIIKEGDVRLNDVEERLRDTLCAIPNRPHVSVPEGKTEEDNEEIKRVGEIPSLFEGAKPHWDLAADYGLIDFELGVKITGAGFPVYRNKGARLQRALINFFLDEARSAGYDEVIPPHLVNADSGFGTGQLPDKDGQMYRADLDQLYLIPTAEVPVTNIYRDVILKESDFPQKLCAYSPCFRREAGSYGKDVRGLNRLHQFDKVEIVQVSKPEISYRTQDEMVAHVAGLLEKLELPYRILRLCAGDLGFAAALTFDFEVYSAAQGRWLEVSSVSNFESYQANRLKLRFKDEQGKTHLAHTLNGSALALPRVLASILENFQEPDGIRIPKVLVPYTGFDKIER